MPRSVFLSGNPWPMMTLLVLQVSRFLSQFCAEPPLPSSSKDSQSRSQLDEFYEFTTGKSAFQVTSLTNVGSWKGSSPHDSSRVVAGNDRERWEDRKPTGQAVLEAALGCGSVIDLACRSGYCLLMAVSSQYDNVPSNTLTSNPFSPHDDGQKEFCESDNYGVDVTLADKPFTFTPASLRASKLSKLDVIAPGGDIASCHSALDN